MPAAPSDQTVSFTAVSRKDMEAKLEEGLAYLQMRARSCPDRGILITRSSPWDFSLELHTSVPYGMTYERQKW